MTESANRRKLLAYLKKLGIQYYSRNNRLVIEMAADNYPMLNHAAIDFGEGMARLNISITDNSLRRPILSFLNAVSRTNKFQIPVVLQFNQDRTTIMAYKKDADYMDWFHFTGSIMRLFIQFVKRPNLQTMSLAELDRIAIPEEDPNVLTGDQCEQRHN